MEHLSFAVAGTVDRERLDALIQSYGFTRVLVTDRTIQFMRFPVPVRHFDDVLGCTQEEITIAEQGRKLLRYALANAGVGSGVWGTRHRGQRLVDMLQPALSSNYFFFLRRLHVVRTHLIYGSQDPIFIFDGGDRESLRFILFILREEGRRVILISGSDGATVQRGPIDAGEALREIEDSGPASTKDMAAMIEMVQTDLDQDFQGPGCPPIDSLQSSSTKITTGPSPILLVFDQHFELARATVPVVRHLADQVPIRAVSTLPDMPSGMGISATKHSVRYQNLDDLRFDADTRRSLRRFLLRCKLRARWCGGYSVERLLPHDVEYRSLMVEFCDKITLSTLYRYLIMVERIAQVIEEVAPRAVVISGSTSEIGLGAALAAKATGIPSIVPQESLWAHWDRAAYVIGDWLLASDEAQKQIALNISDLPSNRVKLTGGLAHVDADRVRGPRMNANEVRAALGLSKSTRIITYGVQPFSPWYTDAIVTALLDAMAELEDCCLILKLHPSGAPLLEGLLSEVLTGTKVLTKAVHDIDMITLCHASEAVITCMSTVSTEAAFAGTPSITFNLFDEPFPMPEWEAYSLGARSAGELRRVLRELLDGGAARADWRRVLATAAAERKYPTPGDPSREIARLVLDLMAQEPAPRGDRTVGIKSTAGIGGPDRLVSNGANLQEGLEEPDSATILKAFGQLIDPTSETAPVATETILRIAARLAEAGDMAQAIAHVDAARALAGRQYLINREDVAAAIDAGAFESAEQHFELYGRNEHQVWPCAPWFSTALQAILQSGIDGIVQKEAATLGMLSDWCLDWRAVFADIGIGGAEDQERPGRARQVAERLVRSQETLIVLFSSFWRRGKSLETLVDGLATIKTTVADGNIDQAMKVLEALRWRLEVDAWSLTGIPLLEEDDRPGTRFAEWEVLETMLILDPRNIEIRLHCANRLCSLGRLAQAEQVAADALALAGDAYLSRRDDVAAAVQRGEFDSALEHYVRHRDGEPLAWPSQDAFGTTAARLPTGWRVGPGMRGSALDQIHSAFHLPAP